MQGRYNVPLTTLLTPLKAWLTCISTSVEQAPSPCSQGLLWPSSGYPLYTGVHAPSQRADRFKAGPGSLPSGTQEL
jgi:hypothetical protein